MSQQCTAGLTASTEPTVLYNWSLLVQYTLVVSQEALTRKGIVHNLLFQLRTNILVSQSFSTHFEKVVSNGRIHTVQSDCES
jgi:hypothetical protein